MAALVFSTYLSLNNNLWFLYYRDRLYKQCLVKNILNFLYKLEVCGVVLNVKKEKKSLSLDRVEFN